MATQTAAPTRPSTAATEVEPFIERTRAWVVAHRRITIWVAGVVVVGLGLLIWALTTSRRSEGIASRQLQGARFAFESDNLPLAASELGRIVENYSGTNAAQEARLLLAQVRLQQGQPQQAVEVLRDFAPRAASAYSAQAYSLLAASYENLGRPREAAEAYQTGAGKARMDFFKAQLLSDAGRAWAVAGDTAQAIAAYRRILTDLPNEAVVTEAKVRLGELTKGTL